MFRIGCHISSAGGYLAMAKRAEALGERFSIIEICTDRLFLGDAFSQCAAGYCSPREYRQLFRAG